MKDRSAQHLKHLLEEKIAGLDRQLRHLQAVRKTLCGHHQNMVTLLTMDLSEISIIEKEGCCLVTVDISRDTSFEKAVELTTAETEKYHVGRLHDASYGSMIPVASLQSKDFDGYSQLFIEIPSLAYQAGLHMPPSGAYLRAFHKGDWDRLPVRYLEILSYAEKHGLVLEIGRAHV